MSSDNLRVYEAREEVLLLMNKQHSLLIKSEKDCWGFGVKLCSQPLNSTLDAIAVTDTKCSGDGTARGDLQQ